MIAQLRADGFDAVWLKGLSTTPETLAAVRAAAPDGIDLLHVDGDHLAAGVRADAAAYLPMLRPKGIAIFHDTQTKIARICDVRDVWPEIRKGWPWAEFFGGPGGYGIGVLQRR